MATLRTRQRCKGCGELMHITASYRGEERCKFCTLAEENKRLQAAFNAAYNYIHSSQDNGAESQARYTAWIEARKKVMG